MGYACPVCETPQADARHLANHLAFTAVLRGGPHEAWLDEHCPGWSEAGEAELADRVAGLADGAEYPQVFEDTTGAVRDHAGHGHDGSGHEHGRDRGGAPGSGPDSREPEVSGSGARDVLERARELTRERRGGDGALHDDAAGEGDGDETESSDGGGADESEE